MEFPVFVIAASVLFAVDYYYYYYCEGLLSEDLEEALKSKGILTGLPAVDYS